MGDRIQFGEAPWHDMLTLRKLRKNTKSNMVKDRYGVYASRDLGNTLIMGYASQDLGKLVHRFSKPSKDHTHRDIRTALYSASLYHKPETIMALLDDGANPMEVYRKVERQAGADVVIRRLSALEVAINERPCKRVSEREVCIAILKHAEATWEAVQANPGEMKRVQGERSAIYKQWDAAKHK